MVPGREEDDDSSDEEDEELEEDRPRSRRPSRKSRNRAAHRPAVKRWDGADEEDDDELEPPPARRRWFHREPKPVYWRARDSLYFEPLIAVAIIVVLLVGLYAYTQNWPPVYVVESNSMQHGSSDVLGVINTGDLVLAQKIPTNQITPYVVGVQTGYSTYGEPGDVILYYPDGQGPTPIIHRAILFLQWDPISSTYNATDISGLKCGNASGDYQTPGTATGCDLTGLTSSTSIELYGVGWRSVSVIVPINSGQLGEHSGFLTMGDNNFAPSAGCVLPGSGCPDQLNGLSSLVEPGWIVGVARGMIPWVGAVKLLIEGNSGDVPPQSWQFLGLTVVGVILLAFGIHYALRAEGIEDERRRDREESEAEADEEREEERSTSRGRRFLRALQPWKSDPDDIDEPPRPKRVARDRPSGRRGRPTPKVRRDAKAKRAANSDDDDL